MQDPVDLLQIKIDEARRKLPEETRQAVDAVPWKTAIIGMREGRGWSFEQLGDLELETELLLCGLLSSENYPKELRERMKISQAQTDELVGEMNERVFKKIREELIKITERKRLSRPASPASAVADLSRPEISAPENKNGDAQILNSAGINIIKEQSFAN